MLQIRPSVELARRAAGTITDRNEDASQMPRSGTDAAVDKQPAAKQAAENAAADKADTDNPNLALQFSRFQNYLAAGQTMPSIGPVILSISKLRGGRAAAGRPWPRLAQ